MEKERTIEYQGYCIDIYYDDNAESPRAWSNLGTIYTKHPHYLIEEQFTDHFEFEDVFESVSRAKVVFNKSFLDEYVALPIFLYDHSGVSISTTNNYPDAMWDTSLFGIIAVSLEMVRKEYGWDNITSERRTMIENQLQSEIEVLNDYYQGDIYGWEVIRMSDNEYIDSCWGYIGDLGLEQAIEEAKSCIDGDIDDSLQIAA